MALDVRIFGVLRAVGIMVSPDSIYRQIERELIRKVAKPIGISGAVLDRIPFQKKWRGHQTITATLISYSGTH